MSATTTTTPVADVKGDETVEEYVLRVCEERVNALREHGEAQIRKFREDAARLKTTDIPPPPPPTPQQQPTATPQKPK